MGLCGGGHEDLHNQLLCLLPGELLISAQDVQAHSILDTAGHSANAMARPVTLEQFSVVLLLTTGSLS